MNNKTLMTYSLLSHLKETRDTKHSSIVELFFPIVEKAIVEYANERGKLNVAGKSIIEIHKKINEYFGIEIPLSVLDFILNQIKIEISDERIFAYYADKSFVINSFVFSEIDDDINIEHSNIGILQNDFENFCKLNNVTIPFDELVKFVCSQQIELFVNKCCADLNCDFVIPKYLSLKFNDESIFKIISDIYLGSLLSSYFEFKIKTPVSKTELLIDTNFYISLIDLNTYEGYLTCSQLFEMCTQLGFKFSILYSTVEQIKVLLNARIHDFASKEVGLIREADVFGACVRKNLDKTQLERIKDSVDTTIRKLNIDVIHEVRIKDLIAKAKNSEKYKELLQIRNNQKLSALNDTVAYFYVQSKRGDGISEFGDVKCWFLNNSYHNDYSIQQGQKLHERIKISANELLSLLWLANPSQTNIDIMTMAKGGIATYIAKYKNYKVPSLSVIKDINNRAKRALEHGLVDEKDIYAISVRMAEGQLTNGSATDLTKIPDDQFISKIKSLSNQENDILNKVEAQSKFIETQNILLQQVIAENNEFKFKLALEKYESKKADYIESNFNVKSTRIRNVAFLYIALVFVILILWLINNVYTKTLNPTLSTFIGLVIFCFSIFIRFVEHKSVWRCLKFTFSKYQREIIKKEIKDELNKSFERDNLSPTKQI
jgi:hypothetical protein